MASAGIGPRRSGLGSTSLLILPLGVSQRRAVATERWRLQVASSNALALSPAEERKLGPFSSRRLRLEGLLDG